MGFSYKFLGSGYLTEDATEGFPSRARLREEKVGPRIFCLLLFHTRVTHWNSNCIASLQWFSTCASSAQGTLV